MSITDMAQDFINAVEERRGEWVRVQWKSTPQVAAKHKGRVMKLVTCDTQTGVDYQGLLMDRESGPLPWGQWSAFPWVIEHKGKEYVRLTHVRNVDVEWFIDGESVSKDEALELYTPSGRAKALMPDAEVLVFTIALENLMVLDGKLVGRR